MATGRKKQRHTLTKQKEDHAASIFSIGFPVRRHLVLLQ
jgi:hypothetical protein